MELPTAEATRVAHRRTRPAVRPRPLPPARRPVRPAPVAARPAGRRAPAVGRQRGAEAEGLVAVAELLTLLRLRAERGAASATSRPPSGTKWSSGRAAGASTADCRRSGRRRPSTSTTWCRAWLAARPRRGTWRWRACRVRCGKGRGGRGPTRDGRGRPAVRPPLAGVGGSLPVGRGGGRAAHLDRACDGRGPRPEPPTDSGYPVRGGRAGPAPAALIPPPATKARRPRNFSTFCGRFSCQPLLNSISLRRPTSPFAALRLSESDRDVRVVNPVSPPTTLTSPRHPTATWAVPTWLSVGGGSTSSPRSPAPSPGGAAASPAAAAPARRTPPPLASRTPPRTASGGRRSAPACGPSP